MGGPGDAKVELERFAAELRALRDVTGVSSTRELARRAHFSHTTVTDALSGKQLPTIQVVRAIAVACGDPVEQWDRRWRHVNALFEAEAPESAPVAPREAASPWPAVPVVDGADPDEAGCSPDARTAHARRIALRGKRRIVGVVELRYSPAAHAAWGRFEGYPLLKQLAMTGTEVKIIVDVVRERDGRRGPFEQEYSYDYHWGDLVLTGSGRFYACASIEFSNQQIAYGETDRIELA